MSDQTAFIAGATGFIGTRLVETLIGNGFRVRALVHKYSSASRIGRFPLEMVSADITDSDRLAQAMKGCQVVVNAAMGTFGDPIEQRKVNVCGTEALLRAAAENRVQRFVHLSTISVYGLTPDGPLNEMSRRCRLPDDYSRTKAMGEKAALRYHRQGAVPVVVLQPTVVYGPFGGWSSAPLNSMRTRRLVLPNGGAGYCNAVFVDDVVQAIILACNCPNALGQAFLISGNTPTTWKEFYACYEEMMQSESTVSMTESEIRRAFSPSRHLSKKIIRFALDGDTQQLVNASLLFKLPFRAVRALIPNRIRKHLSKETEDQNGRPSIIRKWESKKMQMEKPIMPIDVGRFRWMASKTNVEIGKARKILGYEPMFSLMDGMARTREWATWAGLI